MLGIPPLGASHGQRDRVSDIPRQMFQMRQGEGVAAVVTRPHDEALVRDDLDARSSGRPVHDELVVEAVGVAIAAAHLEFSQDATIPHWANHLARAALSAMEAARGVEYGIMRISQTPDMSGAPLYVQTTASTFPSLKTADD